jgi:protein SCO1/2
MCSPGATLFFSAVSRIVRFLLGVAAIAVLAWALAGCGGRNPQFKATDITGAEFGKDFELADHNGKTRRLADFRGKAVALFFGYTQCPDVCPATLAEFAAALKQLGNDADRVQVLFVTIDPERDTQALLAQYVPAFNPAFLGLRGDAEATARTAKQFRVFFQKQAGKTAEGYTMDHSAGTYIYDQRGRLRLYAKYGEGADALVHDLRLLLAEKD